MEEEALGSRCDKFFKQIIKKIFLFNFIVKDIENNTKFELNYF